MKKYFWLFIYAVITLVLVLHHEVWRDEAQVWQLCTHLSVIDLFKHLVNEGHPSFFYLLNMPFAKLGFPILAMQIICWLASCGAVYLILNKSPFNKTTKIILITSGMFLYFFPVIARSYSILPLMVFLLAILYLKQKEHPYWYATIIFLMANTHVIMLGFAGMLTLMFVWENLWKNRKEFVIEKDSQKTVTLNLFQGRKICQIINILKTSNIRCYIYSSLIALFGLFSVLLQLHGTTSSNVFISFDLKDVIANIINVFTKFFVASFDSSYAEVFEPLILNSLQTVLVLFSLFLFIFLFMLIFKNNKKLFLISFLGVLFQFLIYILAYSKCVRSVRTFSAYIIVVFALWCVLNQNDMTEKMRRTINIALIIFFLLTTLNGVRFAILDYRYSYSGGKETAQFIESDIEKDALLLTDNVNIMYDVSILPYLNKSRFVYTLLDSDFIKYVVWNEKVYQYLAGSNYDDYVRYMKQEDEKFKTDNIYLISTYFLNEVLLVNDFKNFKLIFVSKPAILKSEKYYIYKYMGNN